MFQAEICHDIRASTPSGLPLARHPVSTASSHCLNLMFQAINNNNKKKQNTTTSIFRKQEREKPQLSIKYGQNSFLKVCFDKTTISS